MLSHILNTLIHTHSDVNRNASEFEKKIGMK